ncbi:MAG: lipopolysaccharide biosynthesis protein [Caldilineales bacterium]|nr:lipopolysaccharide biosynthesis protein [Caldilineales bacterium]
MRSRATAQNLSAISLNKVAQIGGAFAFAILIPRALGVELFGQLSFALALSLLLQMPGDLGGLDIMGRFVPGWAQEGAEGERRIGWMTWQFVLVRAGVGLLVITFSTMIGPRLAPWLTPFDSFLIGATAALRMASWTPFHLSFGLNRMGRWVVELSWRQLVMIPFLLLLLPWGLQGMLIGLVLSEAVFLILGSVWIRQYLRPQRFDWTALRPYLRFGLGFFVANLVIVALYRSMPVLLETWTRDTVSVGYLTLALSVFMLVLVVFSQYFASFVPKLTLLRNEGRDKELQSWLERIMRYSAAVTGFIMIGIILLTDSLAPMLFGADFQPVARLVLILSLGLLIQPLIWVGRYAATAVGMPRVPFIATVAAMIIALLAAFWLIPRFTAEGAAISLVLGIFSLGIVTQILSRNWLFPPWRAWLIIYLPLLALIPLHDPERNLLASLLVTALCFITYGAILMASRVVSLAELRPQKSTSSKDEPDVAHAVNSP